jgi:hypothetical protein
VIRTATVAGFEGGLAPPNATMLVVLVSGTTPVWRGLACTVGGYCHAHAELSINILEWSRRRPKKYARNVWRLTNSFQSPATVLFDLTAAGLGYSERRNDGAPVLLTLTGPVLQNRKYVILIDMLQSAECQGSGPGYAVSNVDYEFPPVFFAFA